VDSDTLRCYPIDAPEEEDACEGVDDRLPQDEGERIIPLCTFSFPDQSKSRTDMPEIDGEFTDEDEDGTPAAQNVQGEGEWSLPLCLPDSS
jgi:hypothetical protein